MLTRVKRTYNNLKPLIFNLENAPCIVAGSVLTGVSMGLNLLTPYVLSKTIISLDSQEPIEILGVDVKPLAMIGAYGAIYTLGGIVAHLRNWVLAPIGPKATAKLVDHYMDKLMDQTLEYHRSTALGDHQNRLIKCFMAVPNVSTQVFTQIMPTTIEISTAIGILSKWYGLEVGMGLGGILVLYAGYNIATKEIITKSREIGLKKGFHAFDTMSENVTNYEIIHVFNNRRYEKQKLQNALRENAEADIDANTIISKIGIGQSIIAGLGFTTLCMLVGRGVLSGRYHVSDFIIVSAYLAQFAGPLTALGNAISQLGASLTELDIVFSECEKVPGIVDRFPQRMLPVDERTAEIEFKNVSFHYSPDTPILTNVSFKIPAGKKVGIVSKSGAGKSTIGNLIYRFYDPISGDIFINGQNIKDYSIESVRSAISIVPQVPVLFNDTLYSNIAYGGLSLHEEMKEQDVLDATHAAALDSFIAKSPEGLKIKVGEKGAKVSGGQRQRIAIARALLKTPKIIIFDEATSALDNEIKHEVQTNIDAVSKNKTSLHITHELSHLMNADNILVLGDAGIAEQGTHAELIAKENGIYANLWQKRNAGTEVVKLSQSKFTTFQPVPEVKIEVVQEDKKQEERVCELPSALQSCVIL